MQKSRHFAGICILLLMPHIGGIPVLRAQRSNQEGNITRLSAGTNNGAGEGDSLSRDLLPLVMTASSGGGTDVDQQPYQVGVIAVRPSYVRLIASQLAPIYQRPTDQIGPSYNRTSVFQYGPNALAQPLTVDPDDMEIGTRTMYTVRGVNFDKPIMELGLDYDTNSTNVAGQDSDPVVSQLTTFRFPITYGTVPGDSAFLMGLSYKPTYRLVISGASGNEINHDIIFLAGKSLGRFAYAVNNQTVLSSIPIRELSGRNRVFSNRTGLRFAYDIAPKSFIVSEVGHAITTRTLSTQSIVPGLSDSDSIIEDDFDFAYNYLISPKWLFVPEFFLTRTQFENSLQWMKSPRVRLGYFPTTKLVFSMLGGLQFRDTKENSTDLTKLFGIEMDYLVTPKTLLELDLASEIRPSFVDQGIFLREDSVRLGVQEALLLRWLLELNLNYTIRTGDHSASTAGIDQRDIGIEFLATYLLTRKSSIDLSINRYQLKDNRSGLINSRLNVQLSYLRLF